MKVIMALMVLVLLVSAVFAQATTQQTSDDIRKLSARVEYMISVQQAQATELGNRVTALDTQVQVSHDDLYKNQDLNALHLKNDITNEMAFRTDPVRNVMPFILGFCFCFFLYSAIAIKFNFFGLMKIHEED